MRRMRPIRPSGKVPREPPALRGGIAAVVMLVLIILAASYPAVTGGAALGAAGTVVLQRALRRHRGRRSVDCGRM